MAILSAIRRWHFRDGASIREIARRSGLSRNTVRKYLQSKVIEPQYPARDSVGRLSPFEPKLKQWLSTEHKKPKKLRRNLRSMFRDLVALGFTGSYDRVCAFARQWKDSEQFKAQTSGKGYFIPLRFACGEAFQFDWSEDFARIAGKQVKLQIAQFKLAHSRAFVLRAYYQQKHEMLFDANWHAFRIFGGIPKRGIYDNMKTAVDSVGRGKERRVTSACLVHHEGNRYSVPASYANRAISLRIYADKLVSQLGSHHHITKFFHRAWTNLRSLQQPYGNLFDLQLRLNDAGKKPANGSTFFKCNL